MVEIDDTPKKIVKEPSPPRAVDSTYIRTVTATPNRDDTRKVVKRRIIRGRGDEDYRLNSLPGPSNTNMAPCGPSKRRRGRGTSTYQSSITNMELENQRKHPQENQWAH